MPEDSSISHKEDPEKHFEFECPACGMMEVNLRYSQGVADEIFVEVRCRTCGENGFFQLFEGGVEDQQRDQVINHLDKKGEEIQQEWCEWYQFKIRHLTPRYSKEGTRHRFSPLVFLILLVGGWGFFFIDQMYLLDGIFEKIHSREEMIKEYSSRLMELPCLSQAMKEKLATVPIRYTRERPYHRNRIQYGEAGIYWGEEQIKIHRSNFWFFGYPRKSQLIETLIHELRHRVSPALGHNEMFYQLVNRDTQCALEHW